MKSVERGIFEVTIDRHYCKACGLCVWWCPQNVLEEDDEFYPVATGLENCINCKLCERHCPDFAIEVIPPEHYEQVYS